MTTLDPLSSSSSRSLFGAGPWRAMMPRGTDGAPIRDTWVPSTPVAETPARVAPLPFPGPELAAGAVAAAAPGAVAAALRFVLLGPPGSGKSTQGEILAREQGLPHVSVGDLVRQEVASGTELGQKLAVETRGGNLASPQLIGRLVRERLTRDDASKGFVLDGYPRQLSQIPPFEQMRRELGWEQVRVIGLDVPEQEVVQRLGGRGRADDTPEVIRHRMQIYRHESAPVQEYYRARGEYVAVDGTGTIDEVAGRIREALGGR